MYKKYFALLLIFVLAGCSSSRPRIVSATSATIAVEYDSDDALHDATYIANQICIASNKGAQYVRTEKSGLIFTTRTAFFNCKKINSESSSSSGASSNMPIINNFK
jgi:hypothetical protein